jgi:glutamate-5-semialdehyde dehydrogenase
MNVSMEKQMLQLARRSKAAARHIYNALPKRKAKVLTLAAELIFAQRNEIERANRKDIALGRNIGLSGALVERLTLSKERIRSMVKGLKTVAAQRDPVGQVMLQPRRPNGLVVKKMRVPLGTLFIIYESRPNVTIDSAALCIKSGNAVILRGGREAIHSNRILVKCFRKALKQANLPEDCVQLITLPDRKAMNILLKQTDYIDLVIPRGGEGLIRAVTANSRIPVLKHYKGVCHVFIDRYADPDMARDVAVNAKVQRPGVCNAMETLLLDKGLSKKTVAAVLQALLDHRVVLLGCPKTRKIFLSVKEATEADYYREFLNLTLAVRMVDGLEGAMHHIAKYGSAHTDAIVTRDRNRARKFILGVDSSSVMWNASTRFSDGREYGLGAEIGISTDKIHARGPMGAHDLTTYKWVVIGKGQLRK